MSHSTSNDAAPLRSQEVTPPAGGHVSSADPGRGEHSSSRSGRALVYDVVEKYGLVIALVGAVAIFSILRPDSFMTTDNARAMLVQAAIPILLAIGLTFPLALGDFDLSVGSMLGLGGASAVAMMALHGSTWQTAILVGIALGVATGLVNGFFTAYLGASSFVMTLGMSTVLLGVEYLFTDQQTLFQNIQPGYLDLGQSVPFANLNLPVWIALGAAVLAWVVLEHTELGRYIYAVGGNSEAARFAGLPVARLRLIGFVIVGVTAAICGILLTSQGASSSPNAGVPYLLPAYAAAYLGSAAFRPGDFNVAGTVVAGLFLGVISTGLQLLEISTAIINILQGVILVVAMLVSRLERKA
ncbi:MAG: transporter permease [Marmoricola sp.]|nr:transporter permease [Marmoricola sp.]